MTVSTFVLTPHVSRYSTHGTRLRTPKSNVRRNERPTKPRLRLLLMRQQQRSRKQSGLPSTKQPVPSNVRRKRIVMRRKLRLSVVNDSAVLNRRRIFVTRRIYSEKWA